MRVDLRDDVADQRHRLEVVEREQAGAQAVVDVMGVIGDVVGDGRDLRLERGKAPELQIVVRDCNRKCRRECRARDSDQPACPLRSVSGPLCLTMPSSVSQVRLSPSKSG